MEQDEKLFSPKTPTARLLIPLLDALKWQGSNRKIVEALVDSADSMDIYGLIETMANLNFMHYKLKNVKGRDIDNRVLPVLIINKNCQFLVLSVEGDDLLIFDAEKGTYRQIEKNKLHGELYFFQYEDEMSDSLSRQKRNWFSRLVYRFKNSILNIAVLTLLLTLLDLLLPLFVVLIFQQVSVVHSYMPLLIIFLGVLIYVLGSASLSHIRNQILNYISTRMGYIISSQTFTRLVYLSPSYTETASVNSQISRIKDFEGLKRFVTSGNFIALFDLLFSSIYIIAIIFIGGWIGIIPIIALIILILIGLVMRPFHKIKMENCSETASVRQQSLLEILKNTDEIRISGSKSSWIERFKKFTSANIISNYQLSSYVNLTNSISFFVTSASLLVVIYGGVLQVFNGRMSTGALIGILMLYWKIMASMRSAFGLLVQISGLKKSIDQINRFMELPQDCNLKTNMMALKALKGKVKFSEVSIRYNKSSYPALLNVSFENEPGKILGITGHDGAGKSTILKLILGMYAPQGGRIILDNVNVKQMEPLFLRHSISYSPEKDTILTGTIRDNFRCYNPGITDMEILELSERSGLSEYLTLFGYCIDSTLDDQIIREMSPALKKALNLTRMLGRDSKLYLVDEPENHLDRNTLQNIMNMIQERAYHRDASVIIATKDKQILELCDNVIHLNQGRLGNM